MSYRRGVPSTFFAGGTIWTGVNGQTTDALLVVDGAVQAVGEQARSLAAGAEQVDLGGGFLMPSFGDGHAHPLPGGLEAVGPQVRPCKSVDEIVDEVRRFAAEHPDDEWIVGASYDSSLAPDGLFDARWLDAAVPDRPVVLRAWDYHTVWCNSVALERAGITADTPDPVLGEIPRRGDGSVLGTLREWGAVDLVHKRRARTRSGGARRRPSHGRRLLPGPRRDLGAGRLGGARRRRHLPRRRPAGRAGDAVQPRPLRRPSLLRRLNSSTSPTRVAESQDAGVAAADREHREVLRRRGHRERNRRAAGAVLRHRCTDHGMQVWDDLADAARAVDALGFQIHIHAIGDAAARQALDAIEHVVATNGPRDRRPVIAHAQLVDDADIDRFAALGVIPNMQPLWAQLDPLMVELTIPRLGAERGDKQYRMRSLDELRCAAGVRLGLAGVVGRAAEGDRGGGVARRVDAARDPVRRTGTERLHRRRRGAGLRRGAMGHNRTRCRAPTWCGSTAIRGPRRARPGCRARRRNLSARRPRLRRAVDRVQHLARADRRRAIPSLAGIG